MAHPMIKRNAVVLAVLVACFVVLQLFAEHFGESLMNVPWQTSEAVVAVLFFLCGARAFFLFRGGFLTPAALANSFPVLTQGILQVVGGFDSPYPGPPGLLAGV